MTPAEFEYIKRAVVQLEGTMPIETRIKIERTMGQILSRSADTLEEVLVDNYENRLYNNKQLKGANQHAKLVQ